MGTGITEIAIVIFIAAALGIFAKLLKQPTILAYLASGLVIGYFGLFHFDNLETFHLFADMGIMFLLFLVGLEINYTSLRLVGKASLIIGLAQILFTALFVYLISGLLGFGTMASIYIAIALSFSSTIIIVQLLSDKKALSSLYGKLSVGFLLVQDFVAILILITLAGIQMSGGVNYMDLAITVVQGIVLFGIMLALGRKLFPWIFSKIAHSQELLFISSLAWLFSFSAIVSQIGFSIEIGGFLAGLALANSSEHYEIASRVRPLRDFFLLVFFAILGSSIVLSNLSAVIVPTIVLSLFVLVIMPIIVMTLMGLMGYSKRVGFMSGVTMAQISEFSLIIAAAGLEIDHIGDEVVALITAVGVITITVSTYMILKSDELFKLLSPYLDIFEKKNREDKELPSEGLDKPIIIIGHHRTGESITSDLPKDDLLVIDFDPEIVKKLKDEGYSAIFGDIADFELFDKIDFPNADLVISTNPTIEDNLTLLSEIERVAKHEGREGYPKVIVRAENKKDAEVLYDNGADYVLIPEFISGHYLGRVISDNHDLAVLDQIKERDLRLMDKDI